MFDLIYIEVIVSGDEDIEQMGRSSRGSSSEIPEH